MQSTKRNECKSSLLEATDLKNEVHLRLVEAEDVMNTARDDWTRYPLNIELSPFLNSKSKSKSKLPCMPGKTKVEITDVHQGVDPGMYCCDNTSKIGNQTIREHLLEMEKMHIAYKIKEGNMNDVKKEYKSALHNEAAVKQRYNAAEDVYKRMMGDLIKASSADAGLSRELSSGSDNFNSPRDEE